MTMLLKVLYKTHDTPIVYGDLGKDPVSDTCNKQFNFESAVGMCWYLSNNSCPDLIMSVSQGNHFT